MHNTQSWSCPKIQSYTYISTTDQDFHHRSLHCHCSYSHSSIAGTQSWHHLLSQHQLYYLKAGHLGSLLRTMHVNGSSSEITEVWHGLTVLHAFTHMHIHTHAYIHTKTLYTCIIAIILRKSQCMTPTFVTKVEHRGHGLAQ